MDLITYSESLKVVSAFAAGLRPSVELLQVREALLRVLAAPVFALRSNPDTPLAAMDGIAVNTFTVPDALVRLRKEQWLQINTGEPVRDPFNSVVKIEDVSWEEGIPVLMKKPDLFQNVRRIGEDFTAEALLFAEGHRLQPPDLSLLLAAGIEKIDVYSKPVVSFIPTGSELILHMEESAAGKVLESNSAMIAGLVESWGGRTRIHEPVPDNPDDLAQMIRFCAANSSIILVSAGTSKGTRDLTRDVIDFLGKIHFHGVQMSPGRPVLFGEIGKIPVLGLPGYPASAYLASNLYLRDLVCALSRVAWDVSRPVFISAEEIPKRNQDVFYRVNTYEVDDRTYVRRVPGGAGSALSLAQMDGWLHVPPDVEIKKRDGLRIELLRNRPQNTLAVLGASDPVLLRLFDLFRKEMAGYRLLFWQSHFEDAFHGVFERNAHLASINVPVDGPDPFQVFARMIQEGLSRYRIFTREVRLALAQPPSVDHPSKLPKDLKVAIPARNLDLWNHFSAEKKMNVPSFRISTVHCPEDTLSGLLKAGRWDAIFCDVRFLKEEIPTLGEAREHLDIVVPESYFELPAIKKLIEVLMSDEFGQKVAGCDIRARGPV